MERKVSGLNEKLGAELGCDFPDIQVLRRCPEGFYTTNAMESLNATYRKLNRQRSVFSSDTALLKALYLSTYEATQKWTMPVRNWGQIYGS